MKEQLCNWYFDYATKRTGDYEVSPSWFIKSYDKLSKLDILKKNLDLKPTIALWGASQSGKSIFLDAPLNSASAKKNSLIEWDGESDAVKFSSYNKECDKSITILNPHNHKQDATSCITRYKLEDKVLYPDASVKLKLMDKFSLILTLSVGYKSECVKGKSWTEESLTEVLNSDSQRDISKENFHNLINISNILKMLKANGDIRFDALSENFLNGISNRKTLPANIDLAISKIFWDNNSPISEYYSKATKFIDIYKNKNIYSSYKVASLLLNMLTYEKSIGTKHCEELGIAESDVDMFVKDDIFSISKEENDADVILRMNGSRLFGSLEDFAVFQSLIQEIIISVDSKAKDTENDFQPAFIELLEKVDILDFPGVTNIKQANNLTERYIVEHRHLLYSRILKLGKTLSAVIISSTQHMVDSFCLFTRLGNPLPRPEVLVDSMKAWWLEKTKLPLSSKSVEKHKDIQILQMLTFPEEIVNNAKVNPKNNDFHLYFGFLKSLEALADPKIVSYSCLNYEIDGLNSVDGLFENLEDKIQIKDRFRKCENLEKILGDNDVFLEVFNGDGRPSAYKKLSFRADMLKERESLYELIKFTKEELMNALSEVGVGDDNSDAFIKQKIVNNITTSIKAKLETGQLISVVRDFARAIRDFIYVDPEILPEIDPRLSRERKSIALAFVDKSLNNFKESKYNNYQDGFSELGIYDIDLFKKALSYIVDTIDRDKLADFIQKKLAIPSNSNKDLRRFLALKIEDILRGEKFARNYHISKPRAWLDEFEDNFNRDDANVESYPHWKFIKMFEDNVKEVLKLEDQGRPAQVGDKEVGELLKDVKTNFSLNK